MKRRPYPHKKKQRPLEGYGTIQDLADKTGLSVRTLYRLRLAGCVKSWYELNARVVLYHLEQCAEEVRVCYS
jgi:hypothetical protein